MALIDKAKIREVDQTLMQTYDEVAKAASSVTAPLVDRQPLKTKAFVHAFIQSFPEEREWKGEKNVKSVELARMTGTSRRWENTVGVDVEDIFSDVLRPYVNQMADLGNNTARFKDRRVAEILNNGTDANLYPNYDGDALFAASRSLDDGTTQSNNNTSHALDYTNLQESIEDFIAMKDQEGKPLNKNPKYLIVPTALLMTARQLINNELVSDGTTTVTNVLRGALEIIHLPELSSGTTWFLASDVGGAPFVWHELEAPNVTALTSPDDYNVFWKDEFVYGWITRGEMLPGPYQLLQRNIA